ncbi:MAG: sodium-dependent transporter [Planctomycetia bacterium]|nr:sodium-dependent transporter [Planctomycetia bacterium]
MAEQKSFSSRWALMFAMLSMAVGTGSIWRFPRVLATNGGGTFLLPWVVFLFAWSTPLIITEFALGRGTHAGPLRALVRLIGPKFAWMGAWITFVTVAIMFYYSVVTGWVLYYLGVSLAGQLAGVDSQQFYDQFVAGPWPLLMHLVSMLLALVVIYRGLGAIERVTTLLLPSLVVLVVVLAIRAVTLPGASRGLAFMFTVDWSELANYKVWLEALTQNAWDTGSGWGLITAYAIYMRREDDSSANCFMLGIGNNIVSLMAGIAVLCTIFSIMPEAEKTIVGAGNEGLTFVWFPRLFAAVPWGGFFMVLFFAALFMAAFTSLISMVELAVRGLQDLGIKRRRGIVLVGIVGLLGGVPSALSIDFLHNQDWVWGTALIVSGLFFAFAVVKVGINDFRKKFVNVEGNYVPIGRWWNAVQGFLIPVQGAVLLSWFFWQTYPTNEAVAKSLKIAPKDVTPAQILWEWARPIAVENTGTVLLQWAVVLAVFVAANRVLGRLAQEQPRPE